MALFLAQVGPKSYIVNRDGQEIEVAKETLSPAERVKIESLPRMEDLRTGRLAQEGMGTVVPPPLPPTPAMTPTPEMPGIARRTPDVVPAAALGSQKFPVDPSLQPYPTDPSTGRPFIPAPGPFGLKSIMGVPFGYGVPPGPEPPGGWVAPPPGSPRGATAIPAQPSAPLGIDPGLVAGPGGADARVGAGGPQMPGLGGLRSALKMQEEGVRGIAAAKSARSEALTGIYKAEAERLAEAGRQETETLRQEQSVISGVIQDFQEQSKRIAGLQVDPDKFWREKSTGTKILAAISMGLGAAGAALSGGRNTASDIIMGAIDNDIRAQEGAIANARAGLQDTLTVYGLWKDYYGSAKVGRAAAQAFYAKQAELAVLQRTTEFDSPEAKANGVYLVGQLHERVAEREFAFALEVFKQSGVEPDVTDRWIPGTVNALTGGPGMAPQKGEEAKLLRSQKKSFTSSLEALDKLIALRDRYGSESMGSLLGNTQAKDEMESAYNSLIVEVKTAKGMGASFTDYEQALVRGIVGGKPWEMGYKLQKLKSARKDVQREYENWLKTYNLDLESSRVQGESVNPAQAQGLQ